MSLLGIVLHISLWSCSRPALFPLTAPHSRFGDSLVFRWMKHNVSYTKSCLRLLMYLEQVGKCTNKAKSSDEINIFFPHLFFPLGSKGAYIFAFDFKHAPTFGLFATSRCFKPCENFWLSSFGEKKTIRSRSCCAAMPDWESHFTFLDLSSLICWVRASEIKVEGPLALKLQDSLALKHCSYFHSHIVFPVCPPQPPNTRAIKGKFRRSDWGESWLFSLFLEYSYRLTAWRKGAFSHSLFI